MPPIGHSPFTTELKRNWESQFAAAAGIWESPKVIQRLGTHGDDVTYASAQSAPPFHAFPTLEMLANEAFFGKA
jgi:hypothetical protein